MDETEKWKQVPGWEGFYEASDLGGVRSVDRVNLVVNRFGNLETRRQRGKVLKPTANRVSGYLMVSFTRPGGVREYRTVHDVVASAFLGPRPKGMEVCHNNGIRSDCRLANIRYDTRSANAFDRHLHGTMNQARGEEHYFSKLTENDVRWVRRNAGHLSQRAMGEALGVSHSTIGLILRGQGWKSVR